MEEYLKIIENSGFKNITLQKKKPIIVPDDILKNYLMMKKFNNIKILQQEFIALLFLQKNK
jgi:hypothetical protein